MIYFDHNAACPLLPSVLEAMVPYWGSANAASIHQAGRRARHAIQEATDIVAHYIGAQPSEVIWTASATEANNLAILGFAKAHPEGATCYVGATEHESIREPYLSLKTLPSQMGHVLPVDENGLLKPLDQNKISQKPTLCSLMMANNLTGVQQNILAFKNQAPKHWFWHIDAVQAIGKMPVHFGQLGVDLMTLSTHKVGGPKGVGVLLRRSHVPLSPIILGGGHQQGLRSGTENVPGIVGFAAALSEVCQTLEKRCESLQRLQGYFEEKLLACFPSVVIIAQNTRRLPNTTLLAIPGIQGEMLLMELDKKGICVASGSACHHESKTPAGYILEAMGIPQALSDCVIRVSFSVQNTVREIDEFLAVLKQIVGVYGV